MNHSLSKKHTASSLLRFALPTIIMMVFMSLYTIVDGFFISRYIGTNALSSANIVYPVTNILLGIGIMLATGGNAIIAKFMGEGRPEKSRTTFTLIVTVSIIAGIIFFVLCTVFITPLVSALGANELLMKDSIDYLQTLLYFSPALILQLLFQTFFVTEGRPQIGLFLTIGSGITNVILDYVFIVPLGMGIRGAALATGIGYVIPAVFGLVYFSLSRHSLYFTKLAWSGRILGQSCFNGSSEMVTQISTGIITFIFNLLMMKLVGENGVAAITIIQYSEYLLNALFMGFAMGIAPIISYNYGSKNKPLLKSLIKVALVFCGISSLVLSIAAKLGTSSLIQMFTPKDSSVYELAFVGFLIFSTGFLFSGTNIFTSALFTALSDGKTSAIISFSRTFFFILIALFTLPNLFGVTGVWLAIPIAEACTIVMSILYLRKLFHKTLKIS